MLWLRVPWATRLVFLQMKPKAATGNKSDDNNSNDRSGKAKLEILRALRDAHVGTTGAVAGAEEEKRDFAARFGKWPELDQLIDKASLEDLERESKAFTVVDYLTIRPPRSMQKEEILKRLVPGY